MLSRLSRMKGVVLLALLVGLLIFTLVKNGTIYMQPQVSSVPAAYGVNVDISAMLPDTPYTLTTGSGGNFFDLATQLGINTVRITDVQWEMTGKEYPQSSWQYVFNEAASHHIRIVLLLLDSSRGDPVTQQAHTLLGTYKLAHADALWMVDLYNEPDVANLHLMATLRQEATYVRQVAPEARITIGGWKSQVPGHPGEFRWQDPEDIPRFIDLVDVVSPHLYAFDQETLFGITPQEWTRSFLNAVRQNSQRKPILLEEFGAGNGLAPTTSGRLTGSPEWQARVYRGVLQEVQAETHQGLLGAMAWLMAPRPAWSGDIQGNMTGWAFVLDHGHRLLAAASVFSEAAAHA
ncbi:MAG: cellulase family glycosylhydrolase [Chloroflexi bacterium]|nr:cellulase family glycosylhydrolase [Chloroflexota bacterium]